MECTYINIHLYLYFYLLLFDENVGVQQVAAGDVLCDIETDKATLDFESLEDG